MSLADYETAIVLPGGGARAAYQVGALRGVARILGQPARLPFRVISGTSAGAINAAMLAIHADSFRRGIARLARWWRNIEADQVYHADLATLSTHGMHWMTSVLTGRPGPPEAAYMLDNGPLAALLARHLEFARIDSQIAAGSLRALGINATSYTSGQAVTFYQASPLVAPWRRTRRRGEGAAIAVAHLLASTAIPFIFPAQRVGDDYYADGSVRQITPLSPALHLGARRILVIAVGQFCGTPSPAGVVVAPPAYPSFAQIAGHALSSIFLDNLASDLERLQQTNLLVDLVPRARLSPNDEGTAHVDALILFPSRDLAAMAVPFAERLPRGVRYLLHGFGRTEGTGANLLSYLLFDKSYCRALLALGYRDTLARRGEVEAFLTAAAAAPGAGNAAAN
jgi:NTE family protein